MEKLIDLRKQCGLTRHQVAKKLNVSYTAISNYEQGTRKINIEQVLVLAKLYDVSEKEQEAKWEREIEMNPDLYTSDIHGGI